MADGDLAERIKNGVVGAFEPMSGVNQHVDTAQNGAALQIVVDQSGPRRHFALGGGGIAITGQIDQHERAGAAEEDQLLGSARRV